MKVIDLAIERVTGTSGWSTLSITASSDDGHDAIYGPIDADAAIVADGLFRDRVAGCDPFAMEAVWNELFEADRHSRAATTSWG